MNITIKQPAALNERGTKEVNEDYIYPQIGKSTTNTRLFIVSDGMGGQEKGDVASKIVSEQISGYINSLPEGKDPTNEDLKSALKIAESELSRYMKLHTSTVGMGSTLSLVYFGEEHIIFAWVGRSPIFYYRKQQESLLSAQNIPQQGDKDIKGENPNDILPLIYGKEHPAVLNIRKMHVSSVQPDDYIFIASDGILEQVGERTLNMLFKEGQSPEFLIKEIANLSRGSTQDDFSCYMLQVESVIAPSASTSSDNIQNSERSEQSATDNSSSPSSGAGKGKKIPWKEILTSRKTAVISGVAVAAILLIFLGIWWFSGNQKQQQFENLYLSGQQLMESQNYEAAKDTLERALALADDETNKARVRSMFDEASERALDNNRSMAQLKSLGDIAFKRDQWDQAIYYYEKAQQAAIRDTLVVPESLNENRIYAYIKLGDFFYDGESSDLEKSLANYQNAMQIEATDEIKRDSDYLRASVRINQLTERLANDQSTLADNSNTPTPSQSQTTKSTTTARPSVGPNANKSNINVPTSNDNSARVTRSQSTASQRTNLNKGKTVFERATNNNSSYEYEASANYLLKSEGSLDGEGAYMLAIMYHEGKGVSKNESNALKYAKISAQKGWSSGHYLYAHLLLLRRIPKDTLTALSSLRIAADKNHPQAITRLNELQLY